MLTKQACDAVEALIRKVAAQVIVPRFQSLSADDVDQKSGPDDLVTIADREAEEALTPALMDILPGSLVVGEEATAADPHVVDRLTEDGPIWLVDPVDGTRNFVEGSAQFGVMVALVKKGVTQMGWIYTPIEGGMAYASRGRGAFFDGRRMTGRQGTRFEDAFGDYSSVYVDPPYREAYTDAFGAAAGTRQGHCSAYAYLDVARGKLDFVLQYRMSPWDHAAGALLVEEAGGAVCFLDDGSSYTPVPRNARPMLAVADKLMWNEYASILNQKELKPSL
ncbi:MAG: inositol monophosphatase family protein [Pseudomonadota bacterium]